MWVTAVLVLSEGGGLVFAACHWHQHCIPQRWGRNRFFQENRSDRKERWMKDEQRRCGGRAWCTHETVTVEGPPIVSMLPFKGLFHSILQSCLHIKASLSVWSVCGWALCVCGGNVSGRAWGCCWLSVFVCDAVGERQTVFRMQQESPALSIIKLQLLHLVAQQIQYEQFQYKHTQATFSCAPEYTRTTAVFQRSCTVW